ncbi:MAG: outer membrane beta-barrel family protein, partial [Saprospiraceae bacterium]
SHRIDRPDPDELNPFPEYITPREIEAGNPLLKPEQIHSIELEFRYHTEHLSFFPSIYYKQTHDEFSDVTRYINDSTTLTVPLNIEKERWGGLECALSWTPSKNYHFNLNSNIFYQLIDAENIGYEERTSISSDTKLAAYFNVFKSTKIQFNATYRSSTLTAQGKLLPVYFVNAGFRQELFHNKCSLTLTISDLFKTLQWRNIIDADELYQKVTRKRNSQVIYLGFSYRFGISPKNSGEDLQFDNKL